jgi:hypothetical protein
MREHAEWVTGYQLGMSVVWSMLGLNAGEVEDQVEGSCDTDGEGLE